MSQGRCIWILLDIGIKRDDCLEKLYIENYSNTEFMSEEDVYVYLEKVSDFLKSYQDVNYYLSEKEDFDPMDWLGKWHGHMIELSIELFNSFLGGNLLSVSAMTRALIECYVYVSILKKEKSKELIDEWWLCNIIHKMNRDKGGKQKEKLMAVLREYCVHCGVDFESKVAYYTTKAKKEGGWLRELMGEDEVYQLEVELLELGRKYLHEEY